MLRVYSIDALLKSAAEVSLDVYRVIERVARKLSFTKFSEVKSLYGALLNPSEDVLHYLLHREGDCSCIHYNFRLNYDWSMMYKNVPVRTACSVQPNKEFLEEFLRVVSSLPKYACRHGRTWFLKLLHDRCGVPITMRNLLHAASNPHMECLEFYKDRCKKIYWQNNIDLSELRFTTDNLQVIASMLQLSNERFMGRADLKSSRSCSVQKYLA